MQNSARIVHVSDLHLEPAGHEQYPGLAGRLERIRGDIAGLRPDLVIATGDLTNRGSHRSADFELARQWLDELGAPYLAVPGNHDLGANRSRGVLFPDTERYEDVPYAQTGYAQVFGREAVTSASVGDISVFGLALREDDPDGALAHLECALAESTGPIVIAGHYPVVPTRDWPSAEAFGAQGYVDRAAPRLAEIIRSNRRVIAYLCGHVHVTSQHTIGTNCQQFTAGGLGPGAASLRVYDWDGSSWSYSALDVEGPHVFWENFTDLARQDPLFSSGTAAERAGSWMPVSNW